MNERQMLETAIIGQISLCDGAYQQVSDILNDKCFATKCNGIDCATIFKAVSNLYPTTHIDAITVAREIQKLSPRSTYGEIAYSLNYSSVSHLSNQFKKVTGFSPTYFKNLKSIKRKQIEDI